MRILEIVHFFSPLHGGGTISVLYDQAKQLSKRGHEVTIYTSDFEFSSAFIKSLSQVRVRVFRSFALAPNIYVTLGMIQQLKRELGNYDIIHIHCYRSFQSIVVYFFSRLYHIPYVIQAHGGLPRLREKRKMSLIYDVLFGNKLLKNASKILVLNQKEGNDYLSLELPKEKMVIVPNGIDLDQQIQLPVKGAFKKKYSIDDDEKIVLFLARIHPIKGIDVLVKAFANVCEKVNKIRLVIVGSDDGYLAEIQALVKELGITEKVIFTGPLYGKKKLEAYSDAEVYVLPSRYETFPMTVLEAIACNLPVILSNQCGVAEIIKNTAGLIVRPLTKEVEEALLKMLIDENLHETCRANCRSVALQFSIGSVVSQLENLYQTQINGRFYPQDGSNI